MPDSEDLIPSPSPEDLQRVDALMRAVAGERHVNWAAQSALDVLVAEQRMRAERLASQRLTRATWVLAAATVILALATVGLIIATLTEG